MFGEFPVKDKIAVITGAGSGISLAFTRLAASHGAKCIIADLRLTPEASAYIATAAPNVIFAKCDVTKWADLQNLVAVSQKEFGDVPDIYVPGAGIFEPKWSNFWDDAEHERYAEVEINVNHPIKLTRIAMRALLGRDKKGVVLMIASVAGLVGFYDSPLYGATKHAIVGFVKAMAEADALEGVKVVAICPGIVKTRIWTDQPDKMAQFAIADNKVAVTVEEVAQSMLELIQDGKYVGGTVFKIDTGVKEVVRTVSLATGDEEKAEHLRALRERIVQPVRELLKGERGKDVGS